MSAWSSLQEAAEGLAAVTERRMFGCDALFAGGNIFALIWEKDRIGVRLPGGADFERAMVLAGASPWRVSADKKPMSHWVLLPPDVLDEPQELREWVTLAHAQALGRG